MRPPFGAGRAERDDQDATHKISLTRLCLRSGTLQLPFALWDALPEGEVTVRDLDADDETVLRSQPPRRLSGLKPFFERHDVAVNDRLVLQIGDDVDLRLRVEAAPAAAPSRDRSTGAEGDTRREPRAPDDAAGDASGAAPEPEVVERFGRVTVRRLGAGRSQPQVAPSEPAAPVEPATPGAPAEAAPPAEPAPSAGQADPTEAAPGPSPDESRPADPAPADGTPQRRADTGAPAPDAPERAPTPSDEARAQAERRAALNASGDLRTQVVRFLLRPDTPVIVPLDRIATAFELRPEVAQEVMDGIVESPPPTLDVARIRDDHYRVARASKERETADS